MNVCRYGKSLGMFNSISQVCTVKEWDIKWNTGRDTPYVQTTMEIISYLLYKHKDHDIFDNFLKISDLFLKITEDCPNIVQWPQNASEHLSLIS